MKTATSERISKKRKLNNEKESNNHKLPSKETNVPLKQANSLFQSNRFHESYKMYLKAHRFDTNDDTLWKKRFDAGYQASLLNGLADGLVVLFHLKDQSIAPRLESMLRQFTQQEQPFPSIASLKVAIESITSYEMFPVANCYGEREEYLKGHGIPQYENKNVEIRKTSCGLAMFATKDIIVDEDLFVEPATITFSKNIGACYHCSTSIESGVVGSCDEHYCSTKCRSDAYVSYQGKLKDRMKYNTCMSRGDVLYVKLIGMALTQNCFIQELPKFGTFYSNPFKKAALISLSKWFTIVDELGLLGDPRFDFTSYNFVYSLRATNAFSFNHEGVDSSALFKYTTLINHSCVPKVLWKRSTKEKSSMSVYAEKNIKAGEEITLSYGRNNPSTAKRLIDLLTGYNFICNCDLCKRETQSSEIMQQLKQCQRRRFY
jgi:hypothetical protein